MRRCVFQFSGRAKHRDELCVLTSSFFVCPISFLTSPGDHWDPVFRRGEVLHQDPGEGSFARCGGSQQGLDDFWAGGLVLSWWEMLWCHSSWLHQWPFSSRGTSTITSGFLSTLWSLGIRVAHRTSRSLIFTSTSLVHFSYCDDTPDCCQQQRQCPRLSPHTCPHSERGTVETKAEPIAGGKWLQVRLVLNLW